MASVAWALLCSLLGSTGFFDPWETNYAEVAREMVVRDDYLYPFWKDAYFFSKPVLLFWLTAPLYALVSADDPGTPMSPWVELLGRLPSALVGFATVLVVFVVARRFWSRRAAVVSALSLATMPLWAFLSRQAITDMLYAGLFSMALLILAPAFLGDDEEQVQQKEAHWPWWLTLGVLLAVLPQEWEIARTAAFLDGTHLIVGEQVTRVTIAAVVVGLTGACIVWASRRAREPRLHAAALLMALSMLAKGPVGVVIGAVSLGLTVLGVSGPAGVLALLRRSAVWSAAALFVLVGAPWPMVMLTFDGLDDQRKTWFARFVLYDLLGRVGAGVHGDRGGVDYYVRTAGIGMLPWSGFVPLALYDALGALRHRRQERGWRFSFFVVVWAITILLFFSATTTKFHHYILPLAVPVALLIGRLFDGLAEHHEGRRVVVVVAVAFSMLFLRDLVLEPWEWIDLFTYHYKGYKPEYYFPVERLDLFEIPGSFFGGNDSLVSWFVIGPALVGAMALVLMLAGAFWPERASSSPVAVLQELLDVRKAPGRGLVVGAVVGSVLMALFAVHVFWARASQHWSERWLMMTYYKTRKENEPIIAFQMDWKGETFYSKNHEIQIKKEAADLRVAVQRPGREFVLVQTDRLENLKNALGRSWESRLQVIDRSNAKWFLVLVD